MNISVLGGGSWATALVKILSEQQNNIQWWLRNTDAVKHIQKYNHNPDYLSSVYINPYNVRVYENINDSIKNANYIVLAIPAAFIENALSTLYSTDFTDKMVVSGVKGMIPSSHQLLTDWLSEKFEISSQNMAAIAGPCHAEEVAAEKQSFLTIASENLDLAKNFSQLVYGRYIKATPSVDIEGIEYAAIMKNIVALACGITHGMGTGDNFQAVMVSNAILEIEDFLNAINPSKRNLSGSAYLGDLLVTAYSAFSRNRTFGHMIGRGHSVKNAQLEMKMIAEGYYATKSIYEINSKLGVRMPILNFTYKIIYQNIPLKECLTELIKEMK